MKKFLSILICCLMMCGISFAEEETVEPRPYYEMPNVEFKIDYETLHIREALYKFEGYAFGYNYNGFPCISFIISAVALGRGNGSIYLPAVIDITQGKSVLFTTTVYGTYNYDEETNTTYSDPSTTNGFIIPYWSSNPLSENESTLISTSYELANLKDDVKVDLSKYGIESFTVPIPDDAFLEPSAQ